MRNMPSRLAVFFVLITIARVAAFAVTGLKIGWLGYALAIGLAAGVYVFAYFLPFVETKWPVVIGLTIFLLTDLWFNEFETIRTVSTMTLVEDNANFLGWDAPTIKGMMQLSALIYGAFPTVAAASLGWLQSRAERVRVLRTRNWFGKIGVAFAARIEHAFPEVSDVAQPRLASPVENSEISTLATVENQATTRKLRWEEISPEERGQFPEMTDYQIVSRYGGSARRARMWRQWVRENKQSVEESS